MNHARHPYADESPSRILRNYMTARRHDETALGASLLCQVFNSATAPNVYRDENESAALKRLAWLCRRVRAVRYGSRSIQDTADGAWRCLRESEAFT